MNPDTHNTCFSAWLDQYGAMLHHVANGFARGADREDLMQELLLSVWQAIPAFQGKSSVSTYIYRVAHNTALTWHRVRKNYAARLDKLEVQPRADVLREIGASERERETLELVYARIHELPLLDRSLILMHLDGLAYAEMSAIHGLSETNIGARLTRIRQTLSESMKFFTHELR